MSTIPLTKFGGQAPRVAPRQLSPHLAQTALNCKLWSSLEPFNEPLTVNTPTKTGTKKSIYRFGQDVVGDAQYWFHWLTDVDVVRGAVPGDTAERTYFTGDGVPKVTDSSIALTGGTNYPMDSYTLGLPAPVSAPGITSVSGTPAAGALPESRVYVYTYVSAWGEESAPSPASAIATWSSGQTVNLGSLLGAPTGDYNVTAIRIYRTNTAANGSTAYQRVIDLAIGTATYADAIANTALTEVLPTIGWIQPPATMQGLIALPNGGMAGFVGNELCFCEPWKFYAWPLKYRLTTDYPIVGIGAYGSNIVVVTTGNPYLIMGTDPASMSMVKLAANQACVSKRSIASSGSGVVYASPDGLVMAGTSAQDGAEVITKQYFTRDEWQALNPSTMTGFIHDGRYYCFYDTGAFIFDPLEPEAGLVYINTVATGGYVDPVKDALFLQVGNNIVKWDAGATKKTLTWKSKVFVLPKPVNMSFGQVFAASYPVTCKVYADGALKHTQTVANSSAFRLPGGFKAAEWEVQIEASVEIYSVYVSDSMEELRNV